MPAPGATPSFASSTTSRCATICAHAASPVPPRSHGGARRASRSMCTAKRLMQPDVSIVIVTWNGIRHLDLCLASVAAQRGVAAETILVDNGSTDGTAEYVRDRYPWVRLVQLAENRCF